MHRKSLRFMVCKKATGGFSCIPKQLPEASQRPKRFFSMAMWSQLQSDEQGSSLFIIRLGGENNFSPTFEVLAGLITKLAETD